MLSKSYLNGLFNLIMAVQIDQVTILREHTIHVTQISWCLDLCQGTLPFKDERYSVFKGLYEL